MAYYLQSSFRVTFFNSDKALTDSLDDICLFRSDLLKIKQMFPCKYASNKKQQFDQPF